MTCENYMKSTLQGPEGITGIYPCSFIQVLLMGAFILQPQISVAATETVCAPLISWYCC